MAFFHTIPGETKGPPFSFSASWDFFRNFLASSKGPPSIFFDILRQNVKKIRKGPSFSAPCHWRSRCANSTNFWVFRVLKKRILNALKSSYIWALDIVPTYAVPGMFLVVILEEKFNKLINIVKILVLKAKNKLSLPYSLRQVNSLEFVCLHEQRRHGKWMGLELLPCPGGWRPPCCPLPYWASPKLFPQFSTSFFLDRKVLTSVLVLTKYRNA